MADPTPYVVSYSFSGFQANSPTTPLPAQKHDEQYANIAAAEAEIVAAIMDIRRSDGALNNGIVTFESLALGLQLTFDPTNGNLVAAAVTTAQAAATNASAFSTSAAAHDTAAAVSAAAAAASVAGINLTLYLPKAGNLAGLGSLPTSRANLGLGSAAILNVGVGANNIVQLDGSARLPAVDGTFLTGIDILPVGTTIWTNATSPPTGYLKENGQLISRTVFARLFNFAALSGNMYTDATWLAGGNGGFSSGDLSTTFRLSDSRGEFTRSWDDGRGVDSGRVLNTSQADSLKDHTHTVTAARQNANQAVNSPGSVLGATDGTQTTSGSSLGAAIETCPRNVAKLACIKF
jgi:hypothetical protein